MDKEHRHELKENDLQQFLANFGEWRRKYGTTTLLWVLLIAMAIVGWNLYHNVRQTSHDNAWDDLAGATSPAVYPLVAEDHKNPTVKTLAYLWGADAHLAEALTPAQDNPAGPDSASLSSGGAGALDQAERLYQRVLETSREPVFRANAYLGLASVAESRGEREAAATYYDQAIAEADPAYPALVQRATQRKQVLDRLTEPVIFGSHSVLDEPAATEAPAEPTPTAMPPLPDDGPATSEPSAPTPGEDAPQE